MVDEHTLCGLAAPDPQRKEFAYRWALLMYKVNLVSGHGDMDIDALSTVSGYSRLSHAGSRAAPGTDAISESKNDKLVSPRSMCSCVTEDDFDIPWLDISAELASIPSYGLNAELWPITFALGRCSTPDWTVAEHSSVGFPTALPQLWVPSATTACSGLSTDPAHRWPSPVPHFLADERTLTERVEECCPDGPVSSEHLLKIPMPPRLGPPPALQLLDARCVRWAIDVRKLRSSDRLLVSPQFSLPLVSPHATFKLMILPRDPIQPKGGGSFRSSKGRGKLHWKCEDERDCAASTLQFKLFPLAAGRTLPVERAHIANAKLSHDFGANSLCQCAEVWNFVKLAGSSAKLTIWLETVTVERCHKHLPEIVWSPE